MFLSSVYTIITNCVYSTSTIMKIVSQEEIVKIAAAFGGNVGTVNEREVKGEIKWLGNKQNGELNVISVCCN